MIDRMFLRRIVITAVCAGSMAVAAQAQQPAPAAEFGRGSGGQIDVVTKTPTDVSGTLAITSLGSTEGYGATLGGTLLNDRLWFFGSTSVPGFTDAKLTAQPGSRNTVTASISQMPDTQFLSLRYEGMASNNFFFSASFLRLR